MSVPALKDVPIVQDLVTDPDADGAISGPLDEMFGRTRPNTPPKIFRNIIHDVACLLSLPKLGL